MIPGKDNASWAVTEQDKMIEEKKRLRILTKRHGIDLLLRNGLLEDRQM